MADYSLKIDAMSVFYFVAGLCVITIAICVCVYNCHEIDVRAHAAQPSPEGKR